MHPYREIYLQLHLFNMFTDYFKSTYNFSNISFWKHVSNTLDKSCSISIAMVSNICSLLDLCIKGDDSLQTSDILSWMLVW